MATRGVYIFSDQRTTPIVVYRHYDNYPTGAAEALLNALPHAWPLPRFEADEFAAAFMAGNKSDERTRLGSAYTSLVIAQEEGDDEKIMEAANKFSDERKSFIQSFKHGLMGSGGNVRLLGVSKDWHSLLPGDIEYLYHIRSESGGPPTLTAAETRCPDEKHFIKTFIDDAPLMDGITELEGMRVAMHI